MGWDNDDAQVVCRELGFAGGNATRGTVLRHVPTLFGHVNCSGTEKTLHRCPMATFREDHQCNERSSRAAIVCSKKAGIVYIIIKPIIYIENLLTSVKMNSDVFILVTFVMAYLC